MLNTSLIEPKPAAGLLGGAMATLILGVLNRYTGYHAAAEEAAAITTLLAFTLAWLIPSRAAASFDFTPMPDVSNTMGEPTPAPVVTPAPEATA